MTKNDNSKSEWQLNTVIKHTLWDTNERGELENSIYVMVIEVVSTEIHYQSH